MERINFNMPVSFNNKNFKNKILEAVDSYFYLGGRRAFVIDKKNTVEIRKCNHSKARRFFTTTFKIITYITGIIPLIMLIGKAIFRAKNKFYLNENSIKIHQLTNPKKNNKVDKSVKSPKENNKVDPDKIITNQLINENHGNKNLGKVITGSFEYDGTTFGTEKIIRIESVTNALKNAENEKAYYLENHPEQKDKIERCDEIIKACTKYLVAKAGKDWLDSNYFRDLLDTADIDSDKEGATGRYENLLKKYIPAPVNYRVHKFRVAGIEKELLRIGVVTDLSNGFTNLKELIEMSTNPALLEKKKKALKLQQKKSKNKSIKTTIDFALKQIESPAELNNTIKKRQDILQRQMLQIIVKHVELAINTKQKINNNFWVMHLGLLNHKNYSEDTTGWMHHEGNEILDMAEIYHIFDGKEMIFDGKGPFIDHDGIIHLPFNLNRKITLQTIFMNTSVQGNTKNDGLQKEINKKGFKKLEEYFGELPSEWKDIKSKLEKKDESNLILAEKISKCTLETDIRFSTGCLSAKDRTGFVCGRLPILYIKENFEKIYSCHNIKRKRILKKFKLHVIEKDSPAALVVKDNTKENILKVCEPKLPGIDFTERMKLLQKQLKLLLEAKCKEAKKAKAKAKAKQAAKICKKLTPQCPLVK